MPVIYASQDTGLQDIGCSKVRTPYRQPNSDQNENITNAVLINMRSVSRVLRDGGRHINENPLYHSHIENAARRYNFQQIYGSYKRK
jgi:hypothetical protein